MIIIGGEEGDEEEGTVFLCGVVECPECGAAVLTARDEVTGCAEHS